MFAHKNVDVIALRYRFSQSSDSGLFVDSYLRLHMRACICSKKRILQLESDIFGTFAI